jgi:hypothetical protein
LNTCCVPKAAEWKLPKWKQSAQDTLKFHTWRKVRADKLSFSTGQI